MTRITDERLEQLIDLHHKHCVWEGGTDTEKALRELQQWRSGELRRPWRVAPESPLPEPDPLF